MAGVAGLPAIRAERGRGEVRGEDLRAGPGVAAGLGDAGYESTVYGRVENDWVMASR